MSPLRYFSGRWERNCCDTVATIQKIRRFKETSVKIYVICGYILLDLCNVYDTMRRKIWTCYNPSGFLHDKDWIRTKNCREKA